MSNWSTRVLLGSALTVACIAGARPAAGQSAITRLEDIVRQEQARSAAAGPTDTPERGYLGAVVDDRTDRGRGVRILQVRDGGAAAAAGLRAGDLITSLNGNPVRQMADLAPTLDRGVPGEVMALEIVRGETTLKIDVALRRRAAPAGPEAAPPAAPSLPEANPANMEALLRRIEALERRVAELERALEEMTHDQASKSNEVPPTNPQ